MKGEATVALSDSVPGWKVGDRVILTATNGNKGNDFADYRPRKANDGVETEERFIKKIDGKQLSLDKPLDFSHAVDGEFRGVIANLSRNVVIESALPPSPSGRGAGGEGIRGHTMCIIKIPWANQLRRVPPSRQGGCAGPYAIHFHLVGDTMRGSYVLGARSGIA